MIGKMWDHSISFEVGCDLIQLILESEIVNNIQQVGIRTQIDQVHKEPSFEMNRQEHLDTTR